MNRNTFLQLVIFILFCGTTLQGQRTYNYNDGPYIEIKNDSFHALWIAEGKLVDTLVSTSQPFVFKKVGYPTVSIDSVNTKEEVFQSYSNVQKFIALSDIHGQYDLFIKLLYAHDVIDSKGNWSYDKGHLIIVGDLFDRGSKVTETLWFLYQLEKEAEKHGGKVHILLGNHELMVMHGDLGYVNPKYRYTSGVSGIPYPDFFGDHTILGRWIRSKNVATVVNDVGFVHGGFSPKILEKDLTISTINKIFKEEIIPGNREPVETPGLNSFLYFDNGPLWYRGYANPEGFDEATADSLLQYLNINHIVVGHTSMPKIVPIHGDKIILVDSSIKFGKSGEVLIYQDESFYRGLLNGERLPLLDTLHDNEVSSPFEYVYDLKDTDLTIVLDTDLSRLLKNDEASEEYQPATLLAYHNQEFNREWSVRLKTRGNMRKQACFMPPLKIDFSKPTLDYLGFTKHDKLKLVLPCSSSSEYQDRLYREHLVYKMYELIDSFAFRTHLVNVILDDDGKRKHSLTGFFIEDEIDYTYRTDTKIINNAVINTEALDREHYLKMNFFQFMILNTDFSVENKHNLEMVAVPGDIIPKAIPYDFDYAGMVDQDYAVTHKKIPVRHVRRPYFRGKEVSLFELKRMKKFFEANRTRFEAIIQGATYLGDESKESMLSDVEQFYISLTNKEEWEKTFLNPKPMRKG